jgi:hypothetical protein
MGTPAAPKVDPDRVPGSDETLHESTEKIIAATADATPLD